MQLGYVQRRAGELPAEVTGFVGRQGELEQLNALLARERLVTLAGPGGVGKSRIALRAAAAVKGLCPDGTWLAELSSLRDAELLPHTLATLLGLAQQDGRPALDALVDHLHDRKLLIVLDTCEHLVDACAMLADILLRETQGVRLLVTSRQPLDVPGEHTLAVPPLPESDAVRLFAQRAAAVDPDFVLTEANRPGVSALCRRLDGIPLAIELATVRLRALPLTELTARVEDRFRLLTGGRRTALPRHQTLRTAIDWSYELCGEAERLLWARLSVFAGSFDLAAVEAVCAGDGIGDGIGDGEAVETLIGLVDKSVVLRIDRAGSRYRLLDTLREYGAERLQGQGGADAVAAVRRLHRDHYLRAAERFDRCFHTGEQAPMYLALCRDGENIRGALEFSFSEEGEAVSGLALAGLLGWYWTTSGQPAEGVYWLGKGLGLVREPCSERCRGLLEFGSFGLWQGDMDRALTYFREALALAEALGDLALQGRLLADLGGTYGLLGDNRLCAEYTGRGRRLMEDAGDSYGLIGYAYQMAFLRAVQGDAEEALRLCDEALRLLGDDNRECIVRGHTLTVKAFVSWFTGDMGGAREQIGAALALKREVREVFGVAHCLAVLAWVAHGEGRAGRAAWMLGAAAALWERTGSVLFGVGVLIEEHGRVEAAVRGELGAGEYRAAFAAGYAMEPERAAELALRGADGVGEAPRAVGAGAHDVLTRREREVASMVVAGLSNREIAERLVVSKRTVDAHVEHIFAKLGISSRAEIGGPGAG
ncbi:ATP-binding protein [Streptomyces sp. NBC_01465]|uniref:ATP-binding protein n=1 Tax=Streptomyces sp. NBC_01465 TaxID=2903878 RepID=UPI002E32A184|nr:LuxR C-terminal-related transcriptional regulator [Streptomyces sp. NBC_01465]